MSLTARLPLLGSEARLQLVQVLERELGDALVVTRETPTHEYATIATWSGAD